MRREILAFVIAGAAGWLCSGLYFVKTDGTASPNTKSFSVLDGARRAGVDGKTRALVVGKHDFHGDAHFLEALAGASPSEIENWLLALIQDTDPSKTGRSERGELLLRRFAELDPQRALVFLNEHWVGRHGSLRDRRRLVIGVWARTDVRAAVDEALAIDPKGEILPLFDLALPPEKAEELYHLLRERGYDKRQPRYFGNLLSFMARVEGGDLPMVASRALEHSKAERFYDRQVMENVFITWSQKDPGAALAWIDGLEQTADKERATLAFAKAWTKKEPVVALNTVWNQLTPKDQVSLAGNLGSREATAEDVDRVLGWFDEHVASPQAYGAVLVSFAMSIGRSENPEAIAELVERAGTSTGPRTKAMFESVSEWSNKDPQGARNFMESLEDVALRNAAVTGLAYAQLRGRNDPAEIAQLLRQLDLPEDHDSSWQLSNVVQNTVAALARQGLEPEAVLAHFPEELRESAARDYATALADESPEKALAFIEVKSPKEASFRRAMGVAIRSWLGQDTEAVLDWVENLDGEHLEQATSEVAKAWAQDDPDRAIAWLNSRPDGADKQSAAVELAQELVRSDAARGFELAQSLTKTNERDRFSADAITTLAGRDVDQAARLLEDAVLSTKTRTRLEDHLAEIEALREAVQR